MNELVPVSFWRIILDENDYCLSSWSLHYCLICKDDSCIAEYITYPTHKRIYHNNETKKKYLNNLREYYGNI